MSSNNDQWEFVIRPSSYTDALGDEYIFLHNGTVKTLLSFIDSINKTPYGEDKSSIRFSNVDGKYYNFEVVEYEAGSTLVIKTRINEYYMFKVDSKANWFYCHRVKPRQVTFTQWERIYE